MLKKNHGHVVSIASTAGMVGVAGLCDYCASKYGALGFNESLRGELQKLRKTGVKTTVVCPYYINTGMFDGVKTRFGSALPILTPQYATEKIMESILTDQELLVLPRFCYLVPLLRFFLPVRAMDEVFWFLGVNHTMDGFNGRK